MKMENKASFIIHLANENTIKLDDHGICRSIFS